MAAGKIGCIIPKIDPSRHLMVRRFLRRLADGSLPPIPAAPFGRESLIPAGQWLVLMNDILGCCVISGIYHMIMDAVAAGTGNVIEITNALVELMYKLLGGWDGILPPDNTDQGTDPVAAFDYLVSNGFPMPDGSTVKYEFYFVLDLTQWDDQMVEDIKYCLAYFGGGCFCFNVPQSAINQYNAGQKWAVVANDGGIVGGHLVYQAEQDDSDDEDCITWGTPQKMTLEFMQKYGSLFLFGVTKEMIDAAGVTPEGLDWTQALADYQILQGGGVLPPTPAPTVSSITVTPATATIQVGSTVQLDAVATMSDGSAQDITSACTWQSADEDAATVSAGLVTGVSAESLNILAISGAVSGSANIIVVAAPPINDNITGQIGNPVLTTPAGPILMDGAPVILVTKSDDEGHTYVELTAFAKALGAKVTGWDPNTMTFTVTLDTSALVAAKGELALAKARLAEATGRLAVINQASNFPG
jgi:hypothetical protein